MPASSIGALNAWGVYLIASAALVGVMSPQLMGLTGDSREGADWRVADGIRATIDALRPGTTIVLYFGTLASMDQVRLGGKSIAITWGNTTVGLESKWNLPNATLAPSHVYRLRLVGNDVQVTPVG